MKRPPKDRTYQLPIEWEADEGPISAFVIYFNANPHEITDFIVLEDHSPYVPSGERWEEWDWDEFVDFHEHRTGETEDDLIEQCAEVWRDEMERAHADEMEARMDAEREG